MQVIHTSSSLITEINQDGFFDVCLFFSERKYLPKKVAATYTLELDADKVCDGSEFNPAGEAEIKAVAELMRLRKGLLTQADAFALLSEHGRTYDRLCTQMHPDTHSDHSRDIQHLQGRLARDLGYHAFLTCDAEGYPVYIVSMTGRLAELTLQE